MEKFYFSRFTFSVRCKTMLLLPSYNGSTLRGGFGHAFRRIICAFKGKECADCLLRGQCVYAYVFETPIPADAQIMRKYTAAPHPFILEPSTNSRKSYQGKKYIIETKINRSSFDRTAQRAVDQLCGKYLLTERANEGYVVIFDPKTTVGELCTPQERLVQGKKILIFNIGIGR